MKKFIRTLSTSLAILTGLSTCVLSVNAAKDPFNLNCGTGYIKDTDTPVSDTNSNISSSPYLLPKAVDISESDSFPSVRSQGPYGSCASWATTYYQFGYEVAAMNGWNAKNDPTKQFSPKWTYNIINGGIDDGSNFALNYSLLSTQGAVRYSEFTPNTNIDPKDKTKSEYTEWYLDKNGMKNALQYRVSEYKHFYFANQHTANTPIISPDSSCLTVVKSLLNSGKVLTFSTDIRDWDYENLKNQYNSTLNGQYVCIKSYNIDGKESGHAMAIVGYDDNITYDLNGDGIIQKYEKGAFKIVNSYGEEYGNNGYMWVMYDALNKISNAENQNVENRKPVIEEYGYYFINVEKYSLDLIAEITLSQTTRNNVLVKIGQSVPSAITANDWNFTLLRYNGGEYNFTGLGKSSTTATFVFDYSHLYKEDLSRQNFYLTITDSNYHNTSSAPTNNSTYIKNIKLIEKSGKTVVDDNIYKTIDNENAFFKYHLGKVGDINNDNVIDTRDITDLQNYLSGAENLTDNDILVADVNGDGSITINDVLALQYYVAGINDTFANGKFVKLN